MEFFRRFQPKGEFSRNVLIVMSGTALAQAVPVIISPILTRLYSPADLGVLALYLSFLSIGVVFATGRFEMAIPIPRFNREAYELAFIAVAFAALLCGLSLIGVLALTGVGSVDHIPFFGSLGIWALTLPIGVFMMGLYQCMSYLNNRNKGFVALTISRVGQVCVMAAAQIIAGVSGMGNAGLICGYLVGQIAANIFLLRSTIATKPKELHFPKNKRMIALMRRHSDFPRYIIPGQLISVAAVQIPILLSSYFYGAAAAGFYSLAERVLVLPLSIIGTAIGDVYRQRAAEEYLATGQCRDLYVRTVKRLAVIAVVPLIAVAIIAPLLFELIFGHSWRQAGYITSILCTMVFFQILSSPLSQTVLLAKMHRLDMFWQFARLLTATASFYLGFAVWGSHYVSITIFACATSFLYIVHSFMQYKAACGKRTTS
jgi:O-antigen/teichoic acid export membrane protein